MNVGDLMTRNVLTVEEDTPLPRVLQLLIDHGISALPVLRDGEPVGIISESDLVTGGQRARMDRAAWFSLLVDGEGRDRLPAIHGRVARDVMTTPVVTTDEHCDIGVAVRLMGEERIKRLPVTRAGKLVGIISRPDLLRGFAKLDISGGRAAAGGSDPLAAIDARYANDHKPAITFPMPVEEPPTALTADDFRHSVEAAKRHADEERLAAKRLANARHQREIEMMREQHITEDFWRAMLVNARHAAERGETELQIIRFPREVCSDGGRMINVEEAGWPSTLRGQAAEIFHRWNTELRTRGFHLSARTLDYPGGLPGDIGLFLTWVV